ncbi:MAG: 6-carboxytetrahydropterin synthase [Phycisphaerae bacterium]|nr:6-carboxytetrahydropterin synthase [Phycisphaerae bacterium]
MYELNVERHFRAAHALRLYDGSREPLHEHAWKVVVDVAADQLDQIELVMDFHELQGIIDRALGPLEGRNLNNLDVFKTVNPSAERVAEHIYRAIAAELPASVRLSRVTVTEAPGCRASFQDT